MRRCPTLLVSLAAIFLFAAIPAHAHFNGYVQVEDVPGESKGAPDNTQTETVGGSQSRTVGTHRGETIKGGRAVVVGVAWNGSDNPPPRNSRGTVKLTLKRSALSGSLLRLRNEKRSIPRLKLVADGHHVGPKTYVLKNAVIKSYAAKRSGASAYEEIELVFEVMDWEDIRE